MLNFYFYPFLPTQSLMQLSFLLDNLFILHLIPNMTRCAYEQTYYFYVLLFLSLPHSLLQNFVQLVLGDCMHVNVLRFNQSAVPPYIIHTWNGT